MFNQWTIIAVFFGYLAILFIVALWVERKSTAGIDIGNNPVIYALSFGVYCTTWTYYGSVGKAATSGMLFLTVYLGPTIAILTWWSLLRKMIRLKNVHRITSIADFISTRYNKSRVVAAITTIIAIVGIAPYVALQLKSVISTFAIITRSSESSSGPTGVGLIIVGLMIVFTIIIGVRRLDPTERHQGMVVALVLECVVKLVAFLAAGIFVTYFLFDGIGDILLQASQLPEKTLEKTLYRSAEASMSYYMTWTTYLILSMSAILFLPRQFHIAVIENFEESHIKTAMWLFPLYMFLINIFVFPIAMAGLLLGLPSAAADTFVLELPLQAGQKWLSLFVFLGGFSAAMGMVMISSMTMSTMITNHLLLPIIDRLKDLGFLKRYLLQCRWTAVACYIAMCYLFAHFIGESYMLVNIGMVSFAAVLQFAPAMLGGLFWKKGNICGALSGLISGFVLWFYTLLIPIFVRSGWLGDDLLTEGLFKISALKPESLFGVSTFDPLSHAVFWSILCNSAGYVLGSLLFWIGEKEQTAAGDFVDILETTPVSLSVQGKAFIEIDQKTEEIESLLCQYFPKEEAASLVRRCLLVMGLAGKKKISIVELIELHGEIERHLAGLIGATEAYHGLRNGLSLSPREERALSKTYAEILSDLKLTPQDLKNKVDFFQERHALLTKQAAELQEKVLELNREIEERRQAEQALRGSEGKYYSLVDNINIGVYRASPRRGRFLQANPAMAKIFGYDSLDEFMKVTIKDLYRDGKDRQAFLEGVRRNGFAKDRELAMRRKDGTPIWCSASAAATFNEQGDIEWMDGVLEDVTNRKKLEEQLRHSQKMEAIGTLAGGIAHDFNNILTAVLGYGNLLKMEIDDDEVLNNYVEQILIASEKAANLTQSLLAFSRKQIINPKPVDLNDIVRGIEKLLRRFIGEDIEFRTILSDDKLIVMADSGQIEQVLINLSTNAGDAMPGGGLFTIQTEYLELRENSSGFPKRLVPGEYALITASDTGKGMDEQTIQRIFEPFFTTKEIGKGTGLGLSIIYGIIKQHYGDVHVYSEPGKGTSFKIYFPLIRSEVEDPQQTKQRVMLGGNETILIAEDSPDVRKLMIAVLQQFGYTVIEAVDGEDAVNKFAEQSDDIQLLILDVVMPKMNGKEALDGMRAIRKDIKAIFASGYTADIIQRKGILEAGVGFLPKPVMPHVLLSVIRETLDTG
jgi:PAS domain S-box-containing protein